MAPVPEVRVRVLRSFYVRKDDMKLAGTFVHVPATMVPMLISDGKAQYAPEKAQPKKEPETEAKSAKTDDKKSERK
jgi:hypothetical protein